MLDAPSARDEHEAAGQISPVESARQWQLEAEDNVVRRLEGAGLLAPEGKLDAILETVVNNLEVTNGLEMDPPVRCRVLLTTPLESFTIGRTIVLSRGLIDVLPDEASLAVILAHELGHVMSGHELDTRYAFTDRVLIGDREAVRAVPVQAHARRKKPQADTKAVALLENSPYKDKLAERRAVPEGARAPERPRCRALIRPHFGDAQLYRMTAIVDAAPQLDPAVGEADRRAAARRPRPRRSVDRARRADAGQPRRAGVGAREDAVPGDAADAVPVAARRQGRADSGERRGGRTSDDLGEQGRRPDGGGAVDREQRTGTTDSQ